jgi:hypothetical protein
MPHQLKGEHHRAKCLALSFAGNGGGPVCDVLQSSDGGLEG